MTKKLVKSLAFAAVGSLLVAGSAMALPAAGGALDTYFNTTNNWGIDVTDYLPTETEGFGLTTASSGSNMTFYLENPGAYSFGIYSLADGGQAEVFSAANTPESRSVLSFDSGALVVNYLDGLGATTGTNTYTFAGQQFGFYASDGATTIYSDADENDLDGDGVYGDVGMLTYLAAPGSYVFAAEFTGNGDFADLVAQAESINPVPEPATMLLLGTGLAGLAGASRRRKAKK